jgi:hypothetical protein
MDTEIILAKLCIGCDPDSPDKFKYQETFGESILLNSIRDFFYDRTIQLYFSNTEYPDKDTKRGLIEKDIAISIDKNAKFDRLLIRGYVDGKYYEKMLDSIANVSELLNDSFQRDIYFGDFVIHQNILNISKYSDTLFFQIL